MNDPKDVPEQVAPGTQKQDDVSGRGAVQPPGSSVLHPGVSLHAAPSAPPQAVAPVGGEADENMDPLARLTAIVSQAADRQAVSSASMPQAAVQPQAATLPPVMMPPVTIAPAPPPQPAAAPAVEIAAEDRSLASPVSREAKRGFSLFRRKKAAQAVHETGFADEARPAPTPEKRGFWARRKTQAAPAEQHQRRTARDKRWARRRRRVWLEELLGWIFVPIILAGIYFAVLGILSMMGTTPEAVISGLKMILSHF